MLTIRPLREVERTTAHALIEDMYRRTYGVSGFLHQPRRLLVAQAQNENIVGTIGISQKIEQLAIEKLFDLPVHAALEHLAPGGKLCEIERLASAVSHPLVPGALILGILSYAHALGMTHALAAVKPKLCAFVRECLQLPVHTLPGRLQVERAPLAYRGFFQEPPEPCAILFSLDSSLIESVARTRSRGAYQSVQFRLTHVTECATIAT